MPFNNVFIDLFEGNFYMIYFFWHQSPPMISIDGLNLLRLRTFLLECQN